MIEHPIQHVQPPAPGARKQKGGRHGWMMIVCCVPMLAIAVVLVATGVVGASFILVAVGCTAMMALMMRGMNHDGMNHDGQTVASTNRQDAMGHGGSRPLPPPPHTVRGRPND